MADACGRAAEPGDQEPETSRLDIIAAANGATTIQNLTNGFDPSGNITSITDNLTSARSQTVTYDNLNRILTAGGIYGSQTYAYDGVGNRSSLAVGSTTSSYTYAANANQIRRSRTRLRRPAPAPAAISTTPSGSGFRRWQAVRRHSSSMTRPAT